MRKEKQNWPPFYNKVYSLRTKTRLKCRGRKQALSQHLVRPCSKELLTTETLVNSKFDCKTSRVTERFQGEVNLP